MVLVPLGVFNFKKSFVVYLLWYLKGKNMVEFYDSAF